MQARVGGRAGACGQLPPTSASASTITQPARSPAGPTDARERAPSHLHPSPAAARVGGCKHGQAGGQGRAVNYHQHQHQPAPSHSQPAVLQGLQTRASAPPAISIPRQPRHATAPQPQPKNLQHFSRATHRKCRKKPATRRCPERKSVARARRRSPGGRRAWPSRQRERTASEAGRAAHHFFRLWDRME